MYTDIAGSIASNLYGRQDGCHMSAAPDCFAFISILFGLLVIGV